MRLDIRYETRFRYDTPVRESHNELRACPVDDARQRVLDFRLRVDPATPVQSSQVRSSANANWVRLTPDGKSLLTNRSIWGGFKRIDLETGDLLPKDVRHQWNGDQPVSLDLSPDGRYLAVGNKDIRIWALHNKEEEP